MNINELIKCMTDTLNRLYICRNNSSGIVRTNIYNAILYYKKMLIKNDCIFAYNDNSEVKLVKSLYMILCFLLLVIFSILIHYLMKII